MNKNSDLWEQNIESAKTLIKAKNANQMEIARLALECCEIKHGGSVSHKESMYTLSRFAKEIGIAYNTIHSWCLIRKNIFDKIEDTDKYLVPYVTFQRMGSLVTSDTSRSDITTLFKERIAFSNQDERLSTYVSSIRSLCGNLLNESKRSKCNIMLLQEAAFYSHLLTDTFKRLNIGPINHNILLSYDRNSARISQIDGKSLDASGLVLSYKDRTIINHLVDSTATEFNMTRIGKTLYPHKSEMAGKLAVLRTFYKLAHFNYITKDKKSYIFTNAAKRNELLSLIRKQ